LDLFVGDCVFGVTLLLSILDCGVVACPLEVVGACLLPTSLDDFFPVLLPLFTLSGVFVLKSYGLEVAVLRLFAVLPLLSTRFELLFATLPLLSTRFELLFATLPRAFSRPVFLFTAFPLDELLLLLPLVLKSYLLYVLLSL